MSDSKPRMAAVGHTRDTFIGDWKIVQMEVWDQDYVDLVVPGNFTFTDDDLGSFQFGTVRGWLDCRYSKDVGMPASSSPGRGSRTPIQAADAAGPGSRMAG